MADRCYYLDLSKVLATFLVIFGHLYSSDSAVRLYLYAFHMPLFFLISGIFHKYTDKIDWKRYCKRILWPIAIFIALSILSALFFNHQNWTHSLRNYFIGIPLGQNKGILWFLFALFWCKVLTDVVLLVHKPVLSTIIWGVALFLPLVFGKRLPFEMSQGLMAFPFYLIGYGGKDWLINRKPSFLFLIPLVLCLILTIVITRSHGRVSMVDINFGNLANTIRVNSSNSIYAKLLFRGGDVFLFYLNGVVGSAMMLSLALLPFPKLSVVTPLSKSLITVVGTQYLFITPLIKYLGLNHPLWAGILLSLGIFALCYCLHLVLRPVYRLVE